MKTSESNPAKKVYVAPTFEEAMNSESFKNICTKLTKKFGRPDDQDWAQELTIKLFECIDKYNTQNGPERGNFWQYFYFYANGYMIQLAAKDRLVQLPFDKMCGTHGYAVERNVGLELKEEVIDDDDYKVSDATTSISLRQALDRLTPNERYIIEVKYGLRESISDYKGEQIDKIAADCGLNRSQSWKVYDSAVSKLHAMLG